MSNVRLISITPEAEKIIGYCARVSNPTNQNNPDVAKLLSYCANEKHWSIFEQGHMVLEVDTSRGISPQILRHRSFSFQEFSQRYASVDETGIEVYAARRQDKKNRQNSIDDLPPEVKSEWERRQLENWKTSFEHYKWALDNGIAKECARFVLPLGTKTRLYVSGTIRSFIHYIQVRTDPSTQLEHREIAEQAKTIFCEQLPTIAKALGWLSST